MRKGFEPRIVPQSLPVTERAIVELALREAQASYTPFQIDLKDKPEWYAPRVNPASKVPALTYGGPHTPPSVPSSASQKITVSLVLLVFVADLFPHSSLLPKDPVQRAKARFFIDAVVNKYVPNYIGAVARGEPTNIILKGVRPSRSCCQQRTLLSALNTPSLMHLLRPSPPESIWR